MSKPILCLDFDGVIHGYQSGWKGPRNIPDPPVPGALEFIETALKSFEVAIHSSRSRYIGGRRAIKRWLVRQFVRRSWNQLSDADRARGQLFAGLTASDYEEEYQRRAQQTVSRIAFPLWKPAAFVTLDDRALTFTGTWPDLATLKQFKPWNKK